MGLDAEHRTPKTYIPREVYAHYLKSTLEEEAKKASKVVFHKIHDEAVQARMLDNDSIEVHLLATTTPVCRIWHKSLSELSIITACKISRSHSKASPKWYKNWYRVKVPYTSHIFSIVLQVVHCQF